MTKRSKNFKNWLCQQQGVLPVSALRYVLESLIPYSRANMELVFRPKDFFDYLDHLGDATKYSQSALQKAYYAARSHGFIKIDEEGVLSVSDEALLSLKPYVPRRLKGASVMVIFDVPMTQNYKRRWFRLLLRELKFVQVQQSVWMSEYECFETLSAGILELRLENHVRVFEARAMEV